MKIYVYTIAVLACAVIGTNCIVCPLNYCSTVSCAYVSRSQCRCSNGIYTARGGFCGCCPQCLKKLAEGENCAILLLNGTPPTAACEKGTSCQSANDGNSFECLRDSNTAINN